MTEGSRLSNPYRCTRIASSASTRPSPSPIAIANTMYVGRDLLICSFARRFVDDGATVSFEDVGNHEAPRKKGRRDPEVDGFFEGHLTRSQCRDGRLTNGIIDQAVDVGVGEIARAASIGASLGAGGDRDFSFEMEWLQHHSFRLSSVAAKRQRGTDLSRVRMRVTFSRETGSDEVLRLLGPRGKPSISSCSTE